MDEKSKSLVTVLDMIPMKVTFKVIHKLDGTVLNEEEAMREGFMLSPLGDLMNYDLNVTDYEIMYIIKLAQGWKIVEDLEGD